jgi:hypothetical protein
LALGPGGLGERAHQRPQGRQGRPRLGGKPSLGFGRGHQLACPACASLSPDQRSTLRQAVVNLIPARIASERRAELEAAGDLCRRGLRFETASPEELAALRKAVQPVHDTLTRDPQTRKFLSAIAAIGDGVAAVPAPSCGTAGGTSGRAGQLDGVYRVTTTSKDLLAAGAPAGDAVPENYGAWTLVIDRGRFAFTQHSKEACTWGYGTLVVNGDQMEWTFTDGGSPGPTGFVNKPGEFFVFGWSLYRETLTLTPVEGRISAEPFRAKPWQRISATPSSRYFNKRCPPPGDALP